MFSITIQYVTLTTHTAPAMQGNFSLSEAGES